MGQALFSAVLSKLGPPVTGWGLFFCLQKLFLAVLPQVWLEFAPQRCFLCNLCWVRVSSGSGTVWGWDGAAWWGQPPFPSILASPAGSSECHDTKKRWFSAMGASPHRPHGVPGPVVHPLPPVPQWAGLGRVLPWPPFCNRQSPVGGAPAFAAALGQGS